MKLLLQSRVFNNNLQLSFAIFLSHTMQFQSCLFQMTSSSQVPGLRIWTYLLWRGNHCSASTTLLFLNSKYTIYSSVTRALKTVAFLWGLTARQGTFLAHQCLSSFGWWSEKEPACISPRSSQLSLVCHGSEELSYAEQTDWVTLFCTFPIIYLSILFMRPRSEWIETSLFTIVSLNADEYGEEIFVNERMNE